MGRPNYSKINRVEHEGLPIISFISRPELREWLKANHANVSGVWVRLFKAGSGLSSITFEDLLDEGLCFGWSESLRHTYDEQSYLQKFTPRRSRGTTSARNKSHVRRLIADGLMTPAGLAVLHLSDIKAEDGNKID